MESEHETDGNLIKIKNKLNENKIKLWLSPFYTEEDGSRENEMRDLASSYSAELSITFDLCLNCLTTLQNKALENLRLRNNYQKTGKALLKVKIPNRSGKENVLNIFTELTNTGEMLKELVSSEVSVTKERLKVIFEGKILSDYDTLIAQGLKHGARLMVIILKDNSNFSEQEKNFRLFTSTKEDVELLVNDELEEDYLQVADQSGKSLNLPEEEKKALTRAMTLHEKGRAALKDEDYSLALLLLLEAEKQFSFCTSTLLKSVDNCGILSLDIVWCYLNLECFAELPNAKERLHRCELSFHESYGPNMERLISLKGSAGNEAALFMRLHLLQAIVAFHQNNLDEARELLEKAEQELKSLEVDDEQVSQLIELGYEATEARLALRQSRGDLNAAVNVIETKRREREENEISEAKERLLKRVRKKLGKCVNGEWIDPEFHKALMAMGYSHDVARWALAQSCNNICNGISLVQEHPEYLPKEKVDVSEEFLLELSSMGFDSKMAKRALKKHGGDVMKAVEDLVLNKGVVLDFSDSSSDSEVGEPSTSQKKHDEAYSRVAEGIASDEEDHLDLNLVAEAAYIRKYKNLLLNR